MNALKQLVTEHDNILRLIRTMRMACLRMLENEDADIQDFRRFLAFIRTYADKHHHGKEEALLFDEMLNRMGAAAEPLIKNGMLVEHDLGRFYATQLDEAVTKYEQERNKENTLDLLTYAMAYADLLRRHIQRENNAVYPFAQRNLPPAILAALDEQTKTFETENAEERSLQLNALAELERKYCGSPSKDNLPPT